MEKFGVPYLDLSLQHAPMRTQVCDLFADIFSNGQFVLGAEVKAFENDFAAYCGVEHAIAVNSGTSALHLALLAAGIGVGDEVITTPLTFLATVAVICQIGAKPVLVDVDPQSCCLNPSMLEAAMTPKTKAVVPVHLYGEPAEMDDICAIAANHGVSIVEDAAQAHGAIYRGQRVGFFGRAAAFSFYPGKNLGAIGEGGAVVTNDRAAAEQIRLQRSWGELEKGVHVITGFNYRMDAIQGAILRAKLPSLDGYNQERRAIAKRYRQGLNNLPLILPDPPPYIEHVYHVFAIRYSRRDELRSHLADCGVETRVHYPLPVHLTPAYRFLGHNVGDFPIAESIAREQVSLPVYPGMTKVQIDLVIDAVRTFLEGDIRY